MKFARKPILVLLLVSLLGLIIFLVSRIPASRPGHDAARSNTLEGKALFNQHCSGCHVTPAPERLPKEIWNTRVLPMMAIKMGLTDETYERQISEEEREVEQANRLIPDHPMITRNELDKISAYINSNAPDSLPYAVTRLERSETLTQFTRQNINVDNNGPPLITALQYDTGTKCLWMGNLYNQVQCWKWGQGLKGIMQVQSSVVHFNFLGSNIFFTQIGDLMPSELSKGLLSIAVRERNIPLLTSLHRPVYTEIADLNADDIPEILVCNFGKNMGSLSLFKRTTVNEPFAEQKLISMPGATKTFVQDMNGDGKKDIVALIAQADETVYIFYNKGNFAFEKKAVLRFPPDYGTTDLVLFDYNKDGALDILTVHGDNADYSIILKPYHGIRLHINDGKDVFKEEFFYPLYGVTKVLAEDFDKDGDIDFAANAFYPDYGALLDESFVYLENRNAATFNFKSCISKSDLPVRSLALEKGDIDGDGDTDIMLGCFAFSPVAAPAELERKWKQNPYELIVFKNNLR